MRESIVAATGERFGAREVVERRRMVRTLHEGARERGHVLLVGARCTERLRGEEVLPRRLLEPFAAAAADGQHLGSRLLGAGMPLDRRVADEDDGAGRCVEHVVAERERRPATEDDVDLLVPER